MTSNYGNLIIMNSIEWFCSYLSNRSQKSVVNGFLSNANIVSCGVDLQPNSLSTATAKMLADDTSISGSSNRGKNLEASINSDLINLSSWLKANN